MNRKIEKSEVRSIAVAPAPLRDEELTAVTGAGSQLHVIVKLGPGKPIQIHEKLP